MANSVRVLSERKRDEWRALLEECASEYRIINDSDYTGTAWIIEWNEEKDKKD